MGANESKPERKIVLLGKTGDGKSSTGNTILRKQMFKTKASPKSETADCTSGNVIVNGRTITVLDTPGIFDTVVNEEAIRAEIIKCITEMVPSPDMFIMVLKVGRYTGQEMEIVDTMISFTEECGKDVLNHLSVLFTHGEQLEGQTIEEFVKKSPKLQELVERCEGRCHVIDNTHWKMRWWGYKSNRVQVKKLLETINQKLEDIESSCYTNELLQRIENEIKEGTENIDDVNLSPEEKRERAKNAVYKNLLKRLAGVPLGILIGAFLGIGTAVVYVVTLLKGHIITAVKDADTGSCIAAGVAIGSAALLGGVVGGITAWDEAEKADSVCEAVTKTAISNYELAKSIVKMAEA